MTLSAAPELPPLYYLHNFQQVLDWVAQRYSDLLSPEEAQFIADFRQCSQPAQALLVRMVMRKGEYFRASKLIYPEIGSTEAAASELSAHGWVLADPELTLDELAKLLTRAELSQHFKGDLASMRGAKKADAVELLTRLHPDPKPWQTWVPDLQEPLYHLQVMPHCDRFRLMFFGNLRQEWSTFVLAELGLFRYETVAFTEQARAFQHRAEVSTYMQLHACREALDEPKADLDDVLRQLPEPVPNNIWLTQRRDRLLYHLAYALERREQLPQALALYSDIRHPGARLRRIRILEKQGEHAAALALLKQAQAEPENEAERQAIARIQPRLHRQLGLAKPARLPVPKVREYTLTLPNDGRRVEHQVVDHLTEPAAPVFYVENTLINGLLGLLCWPAIFANVPNAFFHPYQDGPADLNRPDFYSRRKAAFDQALALLDTPDYAVTVRQVYREKFGLRSPFLHWESLPEPVLELALACLPASHLRALFQRILFDVSANRSGLPDLIQFYPDQENGKTHKRYRMIEVKGPGDRLQDNQKRWLAYAVAQDIPVEVVHVRWHTD